MAATAQPSASAALNGGPPEERLPPGPPLPRVLQTLGFIFFPPRFLEACQRRYGNEVTFGTLFDSRFVMVFHPDAVRQVFQGPAEQLRAGEANAPLGPVLGERSVLLLDGAEHLRHRRLMLPAFHGQRMRAYERMMNEAADEAIDSWPVGEPFRMLPSMQALTLDVIMSAVFGVEAGAQREELKRRIREMIEPVSGRLQLMAFALSGGRFGEGRLARRFEERRRALDSLLYDLIAARREAEDLEAREDVFSTLLIARDENGEAMTDRELRDELVTLLVAGHETTATGLAWAFDLLLRNPHALERVRAGIGDGDDEYVEAAVKETLRIRPVIPAVGRVVRKAPFRLGQWVIPPGVEINPSIVVMHRRGDLYPQPRRFRPERFLGGDAPDTYTWIPFGGGPRRCLGASFALFEMKTIVRRVLERTELRPVGSRPERIERRGITLVPRNGVEVRQLRVPLRARVDERTSAPEPSIP
jgi:cytochrome P450 family 135